MRISGGKARGIRLQCPDSGEVRPATDRLRESVFSSLGELIHNQRFIDFFAGTGAYGLEALSRGAAGGIFVEKNRALRPFLQNNLHQVLRSAQRDVGCGQIYFADAFQWRGDSASLLFLDPPYPLAREHLEDCFRLICRTLSTVENARAILEIPSDLRPEIPPALDCLRVLGKAHGRDNPKLLILARASPL